MARHEKRRKKVSGDISQKANLENELFITENTL
jgi:hypothetical protein